MKIGKTHIDIKIGDDNSIMIKSFSKTYSVTYNSEDISNMIDKYCNKDDFIIIDKNVYNIHSQSIKPIYNIFIFDALEENKNIDNVIKIIDAISKINLTKKNKIIIIGGGISQDVGGFVATVYKRGIDWIFIPTTLLAMVDSCIGGKLGINRNSKNELGLFSSPNEIIINTSFLLTLDGDAIFSGLGESLKLALMAGYNNYEDFLSGYSKQNYLSIIKRSHAVKKSIIEIDELENNERKSLNYGHTFGHALESATNFFIPHGIAVLIGMYLINKIFTGDKYSEVNNLILEMVDKKFIMCKFEFSDVIKYVTRDKKNCGKQLCFVVLENYGHIIFKYVELCDIKEKIIKEMTYLFPNMENKWSYTDPS